LSAKTYPGSEWVRDQSRAIYQPDYGRRGKVWVQGAFEPATGEATFVLSGKRDSASHIQLLEKVIQTFPADHLLIIEDNLSTHHSRDTAVALAS
jgi:hypothetical protein